MKIVSWNCCMAFNEKFSEIEQFDADIYVIPECEDPERYDSKEYGEFASNYFWVGENKFKGLGIFARDDVKLELMDLDDGGLRYFIPVRVNDSFNLLAIWTNPNTKYPVAQYPKEITQYYELNKDSGFFNRDMVMCGDFNCDVRLKSTHARNVLAMVDKMSEVGLVDTYHYLNDEKQGEESQATFFMYRHLDKPYHLDHVFASEGRIDELEIGDEVKWTQFSDHLPLVFMI